jgi:hypothetical protein
MAMAEPPPRYGHSRTVIPHLPGNPGPHFLNYAKRASGEPVGDGYSISLVLAVVSRSAKAEQPDKADKFDRSDE